MTASAPSGELTVTKLHGLGNDFLVVLGPGDRDGPLAPDAVSWPGGCAIATGA